ncbi:hypothetical protein KLPMCK396B_06160 [Klebsiella pneumoniae]|uniref:hypothetical protein n=1 Tax=Klebsiella pneumoniae TaxID=573 RepID=UPI003B273C4C
MTDITELAQREKFEAWFKSSFHPDKTGPYIKDQLYFAWKAAGDELVEALEKAQQTEKTLESRNRRLDGIITAAEKHIADLESRAVTVENLQESAYRAGLTAGWNLGLANNNEGFNKCLAAHAAGIKVNFEGEQNTQPLSEAERAGPQERRKAERDTEPYGFTDGDRRGMIYKPEHADRLSEPVPLYRHPQPAPVVPDAYVRDEHGRMMLNGVCEPKIGFGTGWNACRAAMLAAAQQEVKGE